MRDPGAPAHTPVPGMEPHTAHGKTLSHVIADPDGDPWANYPWLAPPVIPLPAVDEAGPVRKGDCATPPS